MGQITYAMCLQSIRFQKMGAFILHPVNVLQVLLDG